ncbi:MAG: hypothetical protein KatS3mg109_1536 [Pirellulaceae bacterium]|nr:MAG: hypothetical protein KatS3mg109_1536 [Pirellulaceae bacterium]GIW93291.1 MAG: hypothetical protein KatS3mg110_1332 [Pirellulaceae bacterium]
MAKRLVSTTFGDLPNESYCYRCGTAGRLVAISEGRASFQCPKCRRRWRTVAFYGKEVTYKYYDEDKAAVGCGGGLVAGALVGSLLCPGVGTVVGSVLGAIIGASGNTTEVKDVLKCVHCGGNAYPTGANGKINGYQCSKCKRFFTRKCR